MFLTSNEPKPTALKEPKQKTDPILVNRVSASTSMLECDYDLDPTYLYQAIEAKQWHHVKTATKADDAITQGSTWVVRKEKDGKLRWRLLPLHAAIIFGAPMETIELLLNLNPAAAQCKDDQGMLPAHLAFRNPNINWEIVEELLSAYPQAIQIKDRKGRTPIDCAVKENGKPTSAATAVLGFYTKIAVSGERQRANADNKGIVESRVTALQETHTQTLNKLRDEFEGRLYEMAQDLKAAREDLNEKTEKLAKTERILGEQRSYNVQVTTKLGKVTDALSAKNDVRAADNSERDQWTERELQLTTANEQLLTTVQQLLEQQTYIKMQLDKRTKSSLEMRSRHKDMWVEFQKNQDKAYAQEQKDILAWGKMLRENNSEAAIKVGEALEMAKQMEMDKLPPVQEIITKHKVVEMAGGVNNNSVAFAHPSVSGLGNQ